MITWMLYTVLVSVLVVLGARAIETIGRSLGYPVRWVWTGALVLLVALTALAPYRVEQRQSPVPLPASYREVTTAPAVIAPSWTEAIQANVQAARRVFNARIVSTAQFVERSLPKRTTTYAFVCWSLVTLALVLVFALVQLRFRRARRDWPLADVQGVRVRVAPNVGPVVIGVARPEIVVPHWVLARQAHEQRLVVAHEAEHVRARDTLLLGAACVVAAAMPWNPVVWYILSRLRLAVELDCDARVLRAGAAPHSYGALLIDVAENNSGFRLSAPALADDSSHLQQRIMAMNATRPKFALVRGGVIGALALVAVLAACEAKMPTSADIDQMDAASAERTATRLALVDTSKGTLYFVDGVKMDASKAKQIAATDIEAIEVKKARDNAQGMIAIRTKTGSATFSKDTLRITELKKTADALVAGDAVRLRALPSKIGGNTPPPLVYVDGVKSSASVIGTLNKQDIESVEVLKGTAAATYVNDPDAANGVIVIKTKKGGSQK
jgi:bla regulator protein blaR1